MDNQNGKSVANFEDSKFTVTNIIDGSLQTYDLITFPSKTKFISSISFDLSNNESFFVSWLSTQS